MKKDDCDINTLAAHTRQATISNRSVTLPIYQTSTFGFGSVEDLERYLEGDESQYLYSRYENPTVRAVESKLADLEKGECAYAFSSGMAAITSSIISFLKTGDHVIASNSIYGRTQLFMERWLPRFGIETTMIPVAEFPDIDRYFSPRTKLVYIESPTNPTLRVLDIAATSKVAHEHGSLLLIDNTFATPVNQNPIELGADVVLHSVTKYLGGHSDIVAGASVFAQNHKIGIREAQRTFGGSMDPFAAYLLERGLKTLPLRVERQNQTAQILAEKCAEDSRILCVNYPGLKSHPQHELARQQMRGFGGVFSFDLQGYEQAKKFVNSLQIIIHGASLGGVETMVSLPPLTSHHGQPPENLKAAGITDGTIRFSVGLESPDDLWADIQQALGK